MNLLDIQILKNESRRLRIALLDCMLGRRTGVDLSNVIVSILDVSLQIEPRWKRPIVAFLRGHANNIALIVETEMEERASYVETLVKEYLGIPESAPVGFDELRAMAASIYPAPVKPAGGRHGTKPGNDAGQGSDAS